MSKPAEVTARDHEVPDNTSDDVVLGEKSGTSKDVEDMKRMGKEQLFKVGRGAPSSRKEKHIDSAIVQRNFGFLSIFGFAMILMQTWQALLGSVHTCLPAYLPIPPLVEYMAD